MVNVLTARALNRALGTSLGPWDVGEIDEGTIAAALRLLQPAHTPIPIAPAIEQRRQEIRAQYWRRFGLPPPVM